jgi:hypothetical protein
MYIGGAFAVSIGILLIILYVLYTVNTILKLRCGILPSVGSMALFLLFFGGIIYSFLWNIMKRFMISVLSWAFGLTITMKIKTVLVKSCRKAQYKAFY